MKRGALHVVEEKVEVVVEILNNRGNSFDDEIIFKIFKFVKL